MTLREKLNDTIITNIFITESENRMYYEFNHLELATECEKIADDYAIEFAEWFINNGVEFYDNTSKGNVYKYINDLKFYTIKELLEIFKKEL